MQAIITQKEINQASASMQRSREDLLQGKISFEDFLKKQRSYLGKIKQFRTQKPIMENKSVK